MRVLIVGSGSIGRRHLANLRRIQPECDVTVLMRRDSSTSVDQLQPPPNRIVHTLQGALTHEPNAAIIASPASHHLVTAIPLAKAGVHILVEKPISNSIDDVDQLVATCADSGCVLMTGYNLRFDATLQAVKKSIDDGLIGKPVGVRAEVGQYLPDWRPGTDYRQAVSANRALGGGALLELSHELDYVQWLLGDIVSVSAEVGQLGDLQIDVEDYSELAVRFASGAIGNIHVDFLQRSASRQCRIIGSTGTLIWNGIEGTVRCFQSETNEWSDLLVASNDDRNQMYVAELTEFFDAIVEQRSPNVTGECGRRALAVALAAKQSAKEGIVVTIEHSNSTTSTPSTASSVAPADTTPQLKPAKVQTPDHKAYGFVFARGGSKGLPGKNLLELAGKPLIAHAIEVAAASQWIERVVVSTEDPQIALTARNYGADVPFMRPEHLASDTAAEWLSWQHAIQTLHDTGHDFDTFVSVPATSPLRTKADLNSCIELLNKHRDDTDIVISVCEAHRSPWFNMVTVDENGRANLVMTGEDRVHRRQDAPVVFDMTTVAYAATTDFVMSANSIFAGRVRAVVIPVENSVDIDTEQDFQQAEFLLQYRTAKSYRKAG